MITLHILKLLEDYGVGVIDTDLFFEEASLTQAGKPKEGLWIVTRGADIDRHTKKQQFDIYSRYKNKLTGYEKLQQVLELLQNAYNDVCELPAIPPYSNASYKNVRIHPLTAVETIGLDENNNIVRVIAGEVEYN